MSPYREAHLVVAAVRVLEHRDLNPPSVEKVCESLSFSVEKGQRIVRDLVERGILDVTEGAYGVRLFIRDHLAVEQIPRTERPDKLAAELEKFRNSRKEQSKRIETIKAKQAAKRKSLFDEIEKKLKKDLGDGR